MKIKRSEKKEKEFIGVVDSGLAILKPTVLIPERITRIIKSIQKKVASDEFSILLKGAWTEDGFAISEEFYIPLQEVSGASVDYLEDIASLKHEWNTIYHSHPFSSSSANFSRADEESINCVFECSIVSGLDIEKGSAVISVKLPAGILQVPADIRIYSPEVETEVNIDNIKRKSAPNISYYYNSRWKGWWRYDDWL